MARAVADLRNLGPATARQLADLEIFDEDQLRAMGAVAVWKRLRFRFDRAINVNCLFALEGALRERDWRDLPPETIALLRAEAGLPPRAAKLYRRS